jgi:hypothetical protein
MHTVEGQVQHLLLYSLYLPNLQGYPVWIAVHHRHRCFRGGNRERTKSARCPIAIVGAIFSS